jgi:hypothetical protein
MSRPRRSGLIARLRIRSVLRVLNAGLRIGIRRGSVLSYRLKIREIRRADPSLFEPLDAALEARHRSYWRCLQRRVDPSWLRFFSHVSGIADPRYVPQDIFHQAIERRLNDLEYARYYADKNIYERLFDPELFAVVRLRNVSDTYLDREYRPMSCRTFAERFNAIPEDCFIKPSVGSGGGRRVDLVRREGGAFRSSDGSPFTYDDLERLYRRNYVIQPAIRQHPALARFNPSSVNTLRVVTYRSVKDEAVVVLKAVLRVGRESMIVDNQGRGGLACGVQPDGTLHRYATSKFGRKFTEHPDSGIAFDGESIPGYAGVLEAVSGVARCIPPLRLLSFDVTIDENGTVRIIEINTRNMEINFLQTSGGPFFGDYSDEIVEWCADHPERDAFQTVRL